jgi:hypothetical protein
VKAGAINGTGLMTFVAGGESKPDNEPFRLPTALFSAGGGDLDDEAVERRRASVAKLAGLRVAIPSKSSPEVGVIGIVITPIKLAYCFCRCAISRAKPS